MEGGVAWTPASDHARAIGSPIVPRLRSSSRPDLAAKDAPSLPVARIDEVIHGRLRLGVMAYLANAEVADFNELKTLLEVTQGNL